LAKANITTAIMLHIIKLEFLESNITCGSIDLIIFKSNKTGNKVSIVQTVQIGNNKLKSFLIE